MSQSNSKSIGKEAEVSTSKRRTDLNKLKKQLIKKIGERELPKKPLNAYSYFASEEIARLKSE